MDIVTRHFFCFTEDAGIIDANISDHDEAVKQAIKAVGINVKAAAKDAVDTDGWQHFLAHYDGSSHTTDSGLVYWRTN